MKIEQLVLQAAAYDHGDPRRVHHLMKVYAFSHAIALAEGLSADEIEVLDAAAVLHDIGIHEGERKYGTNDGKTQEREGPAVALPLLRTCGATEAQSERVCWLIAHHHTYDAAEDKMFRILLEADFLVNAYEDALPRENCAVAETRLFRTATGRQLLRDLFLGDSYQPV